MQMYVWKYCIDHADNHFTRRSKLSVIGHSLAKLKQRMLALHKTIGVDCSRLDRKEENKRRLALAKKQEKERNESLAQVKRRLDALNTLYHRPTIELK